jgi:hypothetical protein
MAGHSQYKNIMHRKGRQDAAKAKLFSKLAREITVSAKTGTPDHRMNCAASRHQAARGEHAGHDRAGDHIALERAGPKDSRGLRAASR